MDSNPCLEAVEDILLIHLWGLKRIICDFFKIKKYFELQGDQFLMGFVSLNIVNDKFGIVDLCGDVLEGFEVVVVQLHLVLRGGDERC